MHKICKNYYLFLILALLTTAIFVSSCNQTATPTQSGSKKSSQLASSSSESISTSSAISASSEDSVSSAIPSPKLISKGTPAKTIISKKYQQNIDPVINPITGQIVAVFDSMYNGFKGPNQVSKSTKYGIGWYHLSPDYDGTKVKDDDGSLLPPVNFYDKYMNSDIVNTWMGNTEMVYTAEGKTILKKFLIDAKNNNAQIMFYSHDLLGSGSDGLNPNWQNTMKTFDDYVKSTGAYEAFGGWYIDEPRGAMNADTYKNYEAGLIKLTKYNHDVFKKKFMITFIAPDFDKSIWTTPTLEKVPYVTHELMQYLTDVAFDYYGDPDTIKENYDTLNTKLHQVLAAGNLINQVKVWHIPSVHAFGSMSEAQMTSNLMMCVDYLRKETNPGGLFLYSFGANLQQGNGAIFPARFFNPSYNVYYKNLEQRINDVGRFLCYEGLNND